MPSASRAGPLTSGVLYGWVSLVTLASILGGRWPVVAFVWHERRTAAPMLDLGLFSNGTVRGAAIAQIGTAIAMAGVMFGLIFQFQFAYGWSPVKAGLANLPIIVTMVAATPLSEELREAVREPHGLLYRRRLPCRLTRRPGLGGPHTGISRSRSSW